ncbi:PepSY domain-containing protein [uncultured Nitrospira sp.]|uniref:PepSY domain-containing protein n=1 Tax=uncultured Nitrospira sp. TaxID=157176 RepID=UPI00313FE418
MHNVPVLALTMFLGLLLVSLPNDSEAKKEKGDKEKEMVELATTTKVSIEEAIKVVKEKMPGTVIEAELEKEEGKIVWEVKVVTATGELKEVFVDVQTGQFVQIEEKPKQEKSRHHEKEKASHD